MKRTALLLGSAAILWGCSTDLDINAPYKNITVVYGLLNMRDSIHFVKINKAFLGEGDAYDYALIQDSNEWGGEAITTARVHRLLNGERIGTFDLRDTLVTDRLPGTFYSPEQRLFYFQDTYREQVLQNGQPVTFYLDEDSEYELELDVKGLSIGSKTTIVNDFSFQAADQSLDVPVNLMAATSYGGFELNWTSNRDGKRYEAEYRFNYKEVRGTDTTDLLNITQRIDNVVSANSTSNEPMSVYMDGELFYRTLLNNIPNDPSVTKRIFLGLDLIVSVANDDFHTYLTLGEPVSGIIEDRPTYTNVTNGFGLFGSRFTKFIIGKRLSPSSMEELADGDITAQLRFCTAMPQDVNSPYYCP